MNRYNTTARAPYGVGVSRRVPACGGAKVGGECKACEGISLPADSHVCAYGCGMGSGSKNGLIDKPLGSVYAPIQVFEGLYEPKKAISRGTIFAALDLPFEGKTIKGASCRG